MKLSFFYGSTNSSMVKPRSIYVPAVRVLSGGSAGHLWFGLLHLNQDSRAKKGDGCDAASDQTQSVNS